MTVIYGYNDPDEHIPDPDLSEDWKDEEMLLTNLAQLLDSKKAEGCPWSEWDQMQRDNISKKLRYLAGQ